MSFDFSNVAAHRVAIQAVPYRLFQLDGEPVLQVLPATSENKAYFNALLRQTKESLRALQSSGATAEALDERRRMAKELYAEHVVVGWSGVVDVAGREVPWSREACAAFLDALPGWIFDAVQSFTQAPGNFQERRPARDQVAATAGN